MKKTILILVVVIVLVALGFYVIPNIIGGTTEHPVPIDTLTDDNTLSVEVSIDDDKLLPIKSEVTLKETFKSLPDEYCDEPMREPVLIDDEENFYIKTGTDLTKEKATPSYDYCEFTVFKNLTEGDDIYGIAKATVTPMIIFGGLDFLKYKNNEWVKVTDEIISVVDMEKLRARGEASIAAKKPDLINEDLAENYYIELPRYGTTLKFIHHNTKETIYELKWNGSKFAEVE